MFNFKLYKSKSIKDYIKQRETQEGLKNVFFTKIDKHKTRDKILEDLIKHFQPLHLKWKLQLKANP